MLTSVSASVAPLRGLRRRGLLLLLLLDQVLIVPAKGHIIGGRRRVDLIGGSLRSSCSGSGGAPLIGQHLDSGSVPLERHIRVECGLDEDSVVDSGNLAFDD